MSWIVVKNCNQDVVHVIPTNDLEPHDECVDCRCGPRRETVEGGACDLIIHDPYDCRIDEGFAKLATTSAAAISEVGLREC